MKKETPHMNLGLNFGSRLSRRLSLALAVFALLSTFSIPAHAQTADPAQTIQAYFESVRDLNVERFVGLFTHDGFLEDPVGVAPYRGHTELRRWISSVVAPFTHIDVILQRVLVITPTDAAVLWTTRNHLPDGRVIEVQGIGVYKFNEEGKIRRAREYWDAPGLAAAIMGVPYERPVFASEAPARGFYSTAETLDVEGALALFRPEGILHDPVGTNPYRGQKAIREYLTSLTGTFSGLTFTLDDVVPTDDNHVAIAWTLEARTQDGRILRFPGIGAFEVVDGALRSVEEYWRLSDLMGQL
jgi:steroid delta-isomerase